MPLVRVAEGEHRCLDALSAALCEGDELIVVVDGGDPSTLNELEALGHKAVGIPQGGPGAARNRGVAEARSGVVCFIDSDVLVQPDIAGRLRQIFKDPLVDACFGSYDVDPDDKSTCSRYRNLLHHYVHQRETREWQNTFWSGCGAVRKHAFDSVGGFDSSYTKPAIEDIELGYRLTDAGFRIRLVKDLQVKHLKRWTVQDMVKTDTLRRALPWGRLILERQLPTGGLNTGSVERFSIISCGLAVVCFAMAFVGGWPWVLLAFSLLSACTAANSAFFSYLSAHVGPSFALRCIPFHWLHYLCAGTGFGLAIFAFLSGRITGKIDSKYTTHDPITCHHRWRPGRLDRRTPANPVG